MFSLKANKKRSIQINLAENWVMMFKASSWKEKRCEF